MYRINRATFKFILDKLNAKLPRSEKSDEMARRSVKDGEGIPVTNEIKLLCTLRYLAGGSKWDIAFAHRVGCGSFFVDKNRGSYLIIL